MWQSTLTGLDLKLSRPHSHRISSVSEIGQPRCPSDAGEGLMRML
jgi:hypothetical protein